jgi:hypothetical protein
MNPVWWTPERCEEIRRSPSGHIVYVTDVLADFADAEEQLYPLRVIKECSRKEPLDIEWSPRFDYVACIDPATRANAWTLVIHSRRGKKIRQVCAREWQGTSLEPLRPKKIMKEVAEILTDYDLDWAFTDEWSADALIDIAEDFGISLIVEDWNQKEKTDAFTSLGVKMATGQYEMAPHPMMEKDFKQVRRRPGTKGMSIQLVKTPDGRHADFASASARGCKQWLEDEQEEEPEYGTREWHKKEEQRMVEVEVDKYMNKDEWWAKGISTEE